MPHHRVLLVGLRVSTRQPRSSDHGGSPTIKCGCLAAVLAVVWLSAAVAIGGPPPAYAAGRTVNEVALSPSDVTAGSLVTGTLQVTASRRVTVRSLGIAVRDASGQHHDFPGSDSNVGLGAGIYTFKSLSRTFPVGTYSMFGFWQDTAGGYHHLPSRTLTVRPSVAAPVAPTPSAPPPIGIAGTWTLKQADEFNAAPLDSTMWRAGWFGSGVTGPVDSMEQACYNSANVALPGDGSVHLKVTSTPSSCGGSDWRYSGALLSSNPLDGRTSGGYQYTYGALEARVYVPSSNGQIANWPAVWTDGQNWPTDGENDVMEGLSGQACFHFHSPSGGPGDCVAGNYSGWHTFASDWEPGSVTYYYDGVQVGKVVAGITMSPMYLLLGNTVSSSIGGTTIAADMLVDYIRVWQG